MEPYDVIINQPVVIDNVSVAVVVMDNLNLFCVQHRHFCMTSSVETSSVCHQ